MPQQEKIPADLYEEILYRLPANDLMNFKRVCRDWNELISSQRFIQKHLRRSQAGCDGTLIVTLSPSEIIVCSNPTGNRRSIPYPPEFSGRNTRIACSWDGLVCLIRSNSEDFAIINPSTGESEVFTEDGAVFRWGRYYWFGRHPSTGEYLFVSLIFLQSRWRYYVLPFPGGKPASSVPVNFKLTDKEPVFLHGALHWPFFRRIPFRRIPEKMEIVVLAYDIQEDKLRDISIPFEERADTYTLGVADGCLCAIIRTLWDQRYELWMMKEYGVEESWTKYCSIEGYEPSEYWGLSLLRFLPDGDLLLNVRNSWIVKYSVSDEKNTILHVYHDTPTPDAVLCDDSLVSPSLNCGSSLRRKYSLF